MKVHRFLPPLPVAGLALTLATLVSALSAETDGPIFALRVVPVTDAPSAEILAKIQKAHAAFIADLKGTATGEIFMDQAAGGGLAVLTRQPSLGATEDAALAYDGSDAQAALSVVGTGAPRRFFRELRSQDYDRGAPGYTEVVVFHTRPGTTRAQHLELFDAAEPGFAKEKGVTGHALALSPDGQWLHVVHWTSAEGFARSSRALMGNAGVRKWITSLDFKRFRQRHGAVLR